MFDWNDLRYFLELARRGRLGPTARILQVDHSTVARRISELERALNVKLFERTLNGFILTDIGTTLLVYAEEIENNTHTILENAGPQEKLSGTVRVAAMEAFASFCLAPHLVEFQTQYPRILIELIASTRPPSLTRHEVDISLSLARPTEPGLIIQKLGEIELKLYGAASYLRRHGTPRSVDDLRHHLFIDYVEDQIQIRELRWLRDVIEEPHVVFRSTSILSQRNAALAGLGLAVLPSFLNAGDSQLQLVLADEVSVARDIWLATKESLRFLDRVKALVIFIKMLIARDKDVLRGGEIARVSRS